MTSSADKLASEIERIKKGGTEKYHARNREQKARPPQIAAR